jgi:hypothetical protein
MKNLLVNLIIAVVFIGMFIATIIVIGKVKDKFFVDYDYTLISDELRISKVIKDVKRVDLQIINLNTIEKIGKYGSDTYHKLVVRNKASETIYSSNELADEGKGFYYIAYNFDGLNIAVIECSEKMIYNLLQNTGKKTLEEDYK